MTARLKPSAAITAFALAAVTVLAATFAAPSAVPAAAAADDWLYTDAYERYSLRVPKGFIQDPELSSKRKNFCQPVVAFAGWPDPQDDTKQSLLLLTIQPLSARAGLALGNLHEPFGKDVPGTRKYGAGFAESAKRGLSDGVVVRRAIELDGTVMLIEFACRETSWEAESARIRAVLDSVKLLAPAPPLAAPAGHRRIELPAYDVFTDATASDKRLPAVLREIEAGWNAAQTLLGPGGHDVLRPRFVVHTKESDYAEAVAFDSGSRLAFVDYRGWGHVSLARSATATLSSNVQVMSSRLAVRRWFGGPLPYWAEAGLSVYTAQGIDSGGRPEKPGTAFLGAVKSIVQKSTRTLDQLIEADQRAMTPAGEALHEAWAWTAWFRHGDATKEEKAAYASYYNSLRTEGSFVAARATLDKLDHASAAARMRKWIAKWRP